MRSEAPYAFRNHPLVDHMTGCLRIVEKFLEVNPNYLHVVGVRLMKAGLNTAEPKLIETMLKLGATIHDIGKAYRHYQERIEKYGGGFEYHEILSAVSCYKILSNNLSPESQGLKILLLMAVLNHHQAFRESVPKILSDTYFVKNVLHIAKGGLCDSVSNIEPALKMLGLTIEEVFAKDYPEFKSLLEKVRYTLKLFLQRRFDDNRRWLKLYSLLMFPIILADNLDACEKRSGSSSSLVIEELRRAIGNA